MPISRYQIRNVYSLADPELYKAADKDDPEAFLEGVAMAGLVGVLRQLGDLAEFAAEIFHDLHEEVMSTAARGHGLFERVQQLELEIPPIERAFLSQTSHSAFFNNSGVDWHPNRQETQNLIATGDLPRFVMDSYEECRGPPRLFLLDKFDVGGAGACLKRYTDPSIFKVEASSDKTENAETQRRKKKGSTRKGGETPEGSQPSHVKLHQLFLEERVQTGATEPARRVKLKIRPKKMPFYSESRELYMNKLFISQSHAHGDTPFPSVGSRREDISRLTDADLEVNDNQIAVDEIHADHMQNGYPPEDVASETEKYMDALGTMVSEVETSITANTNQLQSQLSDSQSIEKSTESNEWNNSISKGTTVTSISTESPPRPFACIEIPFHPRVVSPVVADKINVTQNLSHDVSIVDHVASLEEFTSSSNEVCLNHTEKLDSPTKSEEREMDKQDGEFISECTDVLPTVNVDSDDEDSNDGSTPIILVPVILETTKNQGVYDEENLITDSLVNSSQTVISHLNELSSDNTSNDHISVTEDIHDSLVSSSQSDISQLSGDTAFNDHIPVSEDMHEELSKEKVDTVLVISDQAEARVSYISGRETESDNAEIEPVTVADSSTIECTDNSVLKDGTEIKSEEREIESTYSDVNRDDGRILTKLERMEADSVTSDTGTSATVLSVDVDKHKDKSLFVSGQDSKKFGEKEEVDKLLVISSDDMDNNDDNPSLNSKISQDQNHSFLAETDRKQESDTGSVNGLEIKSTSHIDILESAQSSPLEDKVDQSNSQLPMQLDHVTYIDTPLQDLQSSSEKPPAMESNSHDISVSDQVKLPQLDSVKQEDLPPLPPLPPMQWRMKMLQNASPTSTNGGQYSEDHDTEHDSQIFLPNSKHNEVKSAETLVSQASVEAHPMMPKIYHHQVFWPSSIPYLPPVFDEIPSNIQPMKVQRPRSPLIDAVAAHDKTKLRKVSDRDTTQIPIGEERETLLDQIRIKSINLKPVVQTMPIIQGPNTNLRVAAILEKANAIRQAFAGSDDDDDSDNWSD